MTILIFWWTTQFLRFALLAVTAKGKFFSRFPIFGLYLSSVLLIGLVRMYLYTSYPKSYPQFYWYTQFISAALGYGLLWEIYRHSLRDYSGTLRLARFVVSSFFIVVLSAALVNAFGSDADWFVSSVIGFERNLRVVQAVLLALLLAHIAYYGIPLGRNLAGITLGYGIYIASSVVVMTLRSQLGRSFTLWWQYSEQLSYMITLGIWIRALWVSVPAPVPTVPMGIEKDYRTLARGTYRSVNWARNVVLRMFQSE